MHKIRITMPTLQVQVEHQMNQRMLLGSVKSKVLQKYLTLSFGEIPGSLGDGRGENYCH